jgi:hypothetical protein
MIFLFCEDVKANGGDVDVNVYAVQQRIGDVAYQLKYCNREFLESIR